MVVFKGMLKTKFQIIHKEQQHILYSAAPCERGAKGERIKGRVSEDKIGMPSQHIAISFAIGQFVCCLSKVQGNI